MLRKVVLWPILFFFIALAFFFADTDRVHAAAELIDYDVPEKISMRADPRTGQLLRFDTGIPKDFMRLCR